MHFALDIVDETAGHRRHAGRFDCHTPATTLREIIRLRVQEEVDRFNRSDSHVFQGLLQPEEAGRIPNGARLSHRALDLEKQYFHAIDAFEGNGFLVLIDDRRVTELDELIPLEPETKVTFLRLAAHENGGGDTRSETPAQLPGRNY